MRRPQKNICINLVDLLIINAQESTNREYNEALKVIQLEVLQRMKH